MRTALIRPEIQRLMHHRPFQPFALLMENGDRVVIEHPENIAFDPNLSGSSDFYVISGRLRLFSTFEAVTSISRRDLDGTVPGNGQTVAE